MSSVKTANVLTLFFGDCGAEEKRNGISIALVVQLAGLDSCCLVQFEKITKGKRICIAKW